MHVKQSVPTSMAIAPYALLRLLFRWTSLAGVWFVLMAIATPALFLGDDGFSLLSGGSLAPGRDAAALARQLVLQVSATVPLAVAVMVAMSAAELLSSPTSWTVPRLRRGVLSGHTVIAVLVTLLVGAGAFMRTDARTTLIAACAAPVWYAIAASNWALSRRPALRYALLAATLVVIVRPSWYAAAVFPASASWSMAVATGALMLAAAALLMWTFDRAAWERASILFGSEGTVTGRMGLIFTTLGSGRRGVASDERVGTRRTMFAWVHAAFAESSRSVAVGVLSRTAFVSVYALFLYVTNGVIGLLGLTFAQSGLQLSGQAPYPLSRRQRADIQFLCCLTELLIVGTVSTAVFSLLSLLQVPRTLLAVPSTSTFAWQADLLALVALAPLVQWRRALGPVPINRAYIATILSMAVALTGVVLLPRALDKLLGHPGNGVLLSIIAAIGVVMQLLNFVALRYVYARRDLVRPD